MRNTKLAILAIFSFLTPLLFFYQAVTLSKANDKIQKDALTIKSQSDKIAFIEKANSYKDSMIKKLIAQDKKIHISVNNRGRDHTDDDIIKMRDILEQILALVNTNNTMSASALSATDFKNNLDEKKRLILEELDNIPAYNNPITAQEIKITKDIKAALVLLK